MKSKTPKIELKGCSRLTLEAIEKALAQCVQDHEPRFLTHDKTMKDTEVFGVKVLVIK